MRAIDDLLPRYDRHEVHRRFYASAPTAVRAALESVGPDELPLTRLLFAVRRVPALLTGHRAAPMDSATGSMLARLASSGFARLVDTPHEVVLATIGRFWRPDGGGRRAVADAAAFRDFAEPGFAKAVMSFELRQLADGGTEVVTETRIQTTSAAARRAFTTYWLVVRGGSGLIRREILAAAARRLSN